MTLNDLEWLNLLLPSSHVHMDKISKSNGLPCHGGSGQFLPMLRWWALVPWQPLEVLEQAVTLFLGGSGYLIQSPLLFCSSLFWRAALCGTRCIPLPGCQCRWLKNCNRCRSQPSRVTCHVFGLPPTPEQGPLPHQQVNRRRPSEQQWSAKFLLALMRWVEVRVVPHCENMLCYWFVGFRWLYGLILHCIYFSVIKIHRNGNDEYKSNIFKRVLRKELFEETALIAGYKLVLFLPSEWLIRCLYWFQFTIISFKDKPDRM